VLGFDQRMTLLLATPLAPAESFLSSGWSAPTKLLSARLLFL
jgi:hypothetical protein